MKIIYDSKLMGYMSLFENLADVKVKDVYLKEDLIVFVIEKGGMWKAIGKNGSQIKKIQDVLKKKIKVVEFDENVEKFVENLLKPIEVEKVEFLEGIVEIRAKDMRTKGLLIGRESKNLKEMQDVLNRYFKIDVVKIL
tara:strand:- start:167 stop:580 length:414 start_codon:yes stop_codon:yes gene_type:complete